MILKDINNHRLGVVWKCGYLVPLISWSSYLILRNLRILTNMITELVI